MRRNGLGKLAMDGVVLPNGSTRRRSLKAAQDLSRPSPPPSTTREYTNGLQDLLSCKDPTQRSAPVRPLSRILTRSEEHTSELQSPDHLVCRLLLEKKNKYHSTCIH